MIPIEVLQYTIILYAISFIIVIAGFYVDIETYLGSDKRTSEFLYSMGFIGLKYRNGKYENVVMFNPKDIKIINKKLG